MELKAFCPVLSFIFLVSTVHDIFRIKFGKKVILLSSLGNFDVSSGIVLEEKILVFGVFLNPLFELRVVKEGKISLGLKVF